MTDKGINAELWAKDFIHDEYLIKFLPNYLKAIHKLREYFKLKHLSDAEIIIQVLKAEKEKLEKRLKEKLDEKLKTCSFEFKNGENIEDAYYNQIKKDYEKCQAIIKDLNLESENGK